MIATGAAVLWFDACQHTGPPRPDPHAARSGAAMSPSAGAVLGSSVPLRVDVPRVGIHSRLLRVGLQHDGSLGVPPLSRAELAGWYEKGPSPGQRGPAVLVGHVDTKKGPAVFFRLASLRPGDTIEVTRADGKVAAFTVDSVERVSKKHFPTQRVYGDLGFAGLRLITCGGDFKGHSYTDNTIVYAHLTADRRTGAPSPTGGPGRTGSPTPTGRPARKGSPTAPTPAGSMSRRP